MADKTKFSDRLAQWPVFRFFLNSKSCAEMIFKCVLLAGIAYGYPFLCGLIFQSLLHIEYMLAVLLFIAITLIMIYIIVIYLIVIAIIRFIRSKRKV